MKEAHTTDRAYTDLARTATTAYMDLAYMDLVCTESEDKVGHKAYMACRVYKVYKAHRDRKVYKVYKVHRDHRAYKVCKVYRGCRPRKVCRSGRTDPACKVSDHKGQHHMARARGRTPCPLLPLVRTQEDRAKSLPQA